MMKKNRHYRPPSKFFVTVATLTLGSIGLWASVVVLPQVLGSLEYSGQASPPPAVDLPPPPPKHLPPPSPLRGIYMSQCVAGTIPLRDALVNLIDRTELNAVVIDVKDYTGTISFPTDHPLVAPSVSRKCGVADMRQFIATLHDKGIYVIGRITVFQSPFHAVAHPEWAVKTKSDPSKVWRDYNGLSYIDVAAKPYWDYIVALSKEAYQIGFDELNYDYIRYPSDGPMSEINSTWSRELTKPEALRAFFSYLRDQVKPTGAFISADLFGMVTTNTTDMNIGQLLEDGLVYFDYVAPMVYPSHYPPAFLGYQNPAAHPYEVIKYAMDEGIKRAVAINQPKEKIRPWLQDFNLGAVYTPEMIRKEKQAVYDAGLTSWMMWDSSNKYTRGALDES